MKAILCAILISTAILSQAQAPGGSAVYLSMKTAQARAESIRRELAIGASGLGEAEMGKAAAQAARAKAEGSLPYLVASIVERAREGRASLPELLFLIAAGSYAPVDMDLARGALAIAARDAGLELASSTFLIQLLHDSYGTSIAYRMPTLAEVGIATIPAFKARWADVERLLADGLDAKLWIEALIGASEGEWASRTLELALRRGLIDGPYARLMRNGIARLAAPAERITYCAQGTEGAEDLRSIRIDGSGDALAIADIENTGFAPREPGPEGQGIFVFARSGPEREAIEHIFLGDRIGRTDLSAVPGARARKIAGMSLAPSGESLAYVALDSESGPQGYSLWTLSPKERRAKFLCSIPPRGEKIPTYLKWAPAGDRILCIIPSISSRLADNSGHMLIVDAASGDNFAVDYAGIEDFPSWSPDGRRISYKSPEALFIVDAEKGGILQIPLAESVEAAWSPDGNRVCLASGAGLSVIDARGGARRVVSEIAGKKNSLSWLPDNRRIMFASMEGDVSALYLLDTDGGGIAPVDSGPGRLYATLSPTMTYILIEHDAMDIEGAGPPKLKLYDIGLAALRGISEAFRLWVGTSWSPDGEYLLYPENDDIALAQASTGATIFRSADPGRFRLATSMDNVARWLRGKEAFAFVDRHASAQGTPQILLYDAKGGGIAKIAEGGHIRSLSQYIGM